MNVPQAGFSFVQPLLTRSPHNLREPYSLPLDKTKSWTRGFESTTFGLKSSLAQLGSFIAFFAATFWFNLQLDLPSRQYLGGPRCCCQQEDLAVPKPFPGPVRPERVGSRSLAYQLTSPGPPKLRRPLIQLVWSFEFQPVLKTRFEPCDDARSPVGFKCSFLIADVEFSSPENPLPEFSLMPGLSYMVSCLSCVHPRNYSLLSAVSRIIFPLILAFICVYNLTWDKARTGPRYATWFLKFLS